VEESEYLQNICNKKRSFFGIFVNFTLRYVIKAKITFILMVAPVAFSSSE